MNDTTRVTNTYNIFDTMECESSSEESFHVCNHFMWSSPKLAGTVLKA